MENAQRRGPFYLAIFVVFYHYYHALRSEHGWWSIISPPLDEQLVLSRAQRFYVLLAKLMAAMALNAAVFGNDPSKVSGASTALVHLEAWLES